MKCLLSSTMVVESGNQKLTLPSITSWFNMQLLTKRRSLLSSSSSSSSSSPSSSSLSSPSLLRSSYQALKLCVRTYLPTSQVWRKTCQSKTFIFSPRLSGGCDRWFGRTRLPPWPRHGPRHKQAVCPHQVLCGDDF